MTGKCPVMVSRRLDAVGNWVRWRWLPIEDLLNVLRVWTLGLLRTRLTSAFLVARNLWYGERHPSRWQ